MDGGTVTLTELWCWFYRRLGWSSAVGSTHSQWLEVAHWLRAPDLRKGPQQVPGECISRKRGFPGRGPVGCSLEGAGGQHGEGRDV